jgi:Ribbon-helix-helix protein, copG family
MARGHPIEIDLDTAHRLKAQGMSAAEIARQLKLPVSTLKDHLKRPLPAKTTDVYKSGSTEVHTGGAANVHIDIPLSDLADFQEVLAWWRKRKHLLNAANESPAPTERWTLHIEKPFMEKIKAEAEAEHVTVTEVINRIIRHYYER